MLLESVERYDTKRIIKLLCIETLISENRLPPQIHTVPALMVVNEQTFLYGKQVFDYLLLPGAGKLIIQPDDSNKNMPSNTQNSKGGPGQQYVPDEPLGFSIAVNGMSDGFSLIDDAEEMESNMGNNDRVYNWTPIGSVTESSNELQFADTNQEVRTRKELPSLALLQEQRSMDLNMPNTINPNSMPNAVSSR
jgi:hypothetical protein